MDDELLSIFVSESREHLATIEADLLAIEEAGENVDAALVNKVFRAAHSIKGTSSFFGLERVKDLAHKAETVLDMLRSGTMVPNAEITNLLLAAFDKLREMVNDCSNTESYDTSDLISSLTTLASSYLPQEQKASLSETVSLISEGSAAPVLVTKRDFEQAAKTGKVLYSVEYDLIHDIDRKGDNVLNVFRGLWNAGEIVDCAVDFEAAGCLDDPIGTKLPLRLVFAVVPQEVDLNLLFPNNRDRVYPLREESQVQLEAEASSPEHLETAPDLPPPQELPVVREPLPEVKPKAPAAKPQPPSGQSASVVSVEDSIRVNVGVLERLMNLAGELVLGRNQLRASIAQNNAQALVTADQRINQITSELQDVIMQTRLQPIGNVFSKFPRVVRDLAAALGKEIDLDIRGKDVALDKSLIEALSDPLTHMVRNAVDHGVETPDERVRAGKKRNGNIVIDARHEAGQIVVEIADDGSGIDPERIAQAAESKGLIVQEQLQRMSAQDKLALIFLPGLSTAKKLTDISGRGVGMDVVKTNLDQLGGKVEINSILGKGTTFRIKLPLTLAIIPSLIVSVEGERFALPQINVEELLRVQPGSKSKTRIEIVGGSEVLVLRDRLIPLLRFSSLLGVLPTYSDPNTGSQEIDRRGNLADRRLAQAEMQETGAEHTTAMRRRRGDDRRRVSTAALEIAVVTTGTQTYGLVVGGFHDTEEIVVKPLGCHLKGLSEYAGATILGDGTVALILDVAGLAAKAELNAVSGTARAQELKDDYEQEKLVDTHALLLFHNCPDQLCAVPLDTILRIERITQSQVQMIGGRRTMQHRGGFLPLVTLSDTASLSPINDDQELAVMISTVRGHEVGLLGAMPVDVLEVQAVIDQQTHRQRGVAGSTIIRDRTALVADLLELVDSTWPEWAAERAAEREAVRPVAEAEGKVVLLAEDSDFFRTQVTRYIEEDGYKVLAAPDGEAGWELLLQNIDRVRVVVTDIEMPRLDGLGLTRRIRAEARTSGLPVIAVTSLAGDDDIARINAAGATEYQTKLDREALLAAIDRLMPDQEVSCIPAD